MPLLHSIGLGGGSIVRESEDGKVDVGPDSVGHYLTTEAKVFGGKTLTTSDIAVAAGKASMGDKTFISEISPELVKKAQDRIKVLLEGVVDLSKTSPDPLPVLLVGGGSVLAPESLKGASKLIFPPFHDVANAVGAAVSKVSGTVDTVQSTLHQTQQQAIEYAKKLAVQRAVEAGAIESTVTIAEVDALPIQYVSNQIRTVVKAVGELDVNLLPPEPETKASDEDEMEVEEVKAVAANIVEKASADPFAYTPEIKMNKETGNLEWIVSETDLDWLAEGCYVLGCAGGGSPHSTRIQLRDQVRDGHTLKIISPDVLKKDDLIYCKSRYSLFPGPRLTRHRGRSYG